MEKGKLCLVVKFGRRWRRRLHEQRKEPSMLGTGTLPPPPNRDDTTWRDFMGNREILLPLLNLW